MSFTYDPNQSSARDRARFDVGDTDPAKPLYSDEEYDAKLNRLPYNLAVADILTSLANKYAAYPDEYDESGRVKVSWRDKGRIWLQEAARLRDQPVEETTTGPQQNGIAIAEITTNTDGYRPHQNSGARSWNPWGG